MNIKLNKANQNNSTKLNIGENNVPFISFKKLDDTGLVVNGFSTRLGGVSKGHLSSMNLGYNRGEPDENVTKNHEIFATALGVDYKNIVTTNQTHTTNVRIVTEKDKGKGIITPRDYHDIDGLITGEPNIVLATYYADCVPLYFLDTKNKVIGLSHSGWRGTVNRMGKVTIEAMINHFNSSPKDIIACIGPSICQNCYEVSEDVALEFAGEFKGHEDEILINKGNGKYLLSLWNANKIVLTEAGITDENLAVTDLCTCCNKDVLFSHRGHNGLRGNLAAFLMLKD